MARQKAPKILGREAILATDDLPRELVDVPEWGGQVFVRTMTGHEKDRFEHSRYSAETAGIHEGIRARFIAYTVCDDAGVLLFTEEDVEALGAKSCAALDRCYEVAARLNKMTTKDIEELIKNYVAARTADSPSD